MKTTALAPWFGSNRMLAENVGRALDGCSWVGVPFAGGMCELAHIKARTMLVSDLHRHIINLARVVAHPFMRPELMKYLRRAVFHPDELDQAQEWCKVYKPIDSSGEPDLEAAYRYFVCVWMGRSHIAGTKDEFHGRLSTRWNASGGDSNKRYRSAVKSLAEWGRICRRCNFSVMDAFDFLRRCEDSDGHGVYCDPPFLGAGLAYKHGETKDTETDWHMRLSGFLNGFARTRIVCRFYDHPLIRQFYPAAEWDWRPLTGGRKQTNGVAPEVLLIRNGDRDLFAEAP
jgi:DNA adenine methylase